MEQVATRSAGQEGWRLSEQDMDLYGRIFSLQGDGRWDEAAALIPQIQDPLLLGYVHHQRLMASPQKARLTELRDWLDSYADLPMAEIVYSVAQGRMAPARSPQKAQPAKAAAAKKEPSKKEPPKKEAAGKKDQKATQAAPPGEGRAPGGSTLSRRPAAV